jgi:hypothetical protein
MNFALVKFSSSPSRNRSYPYSSMIMEIGASAKYTHPFGSEHEMVATVHDMLAKQKRHDDLSRVLNKVGDGGYHFFDLELTREEAESLGWNDSVQWEPDRK